MLAAPGHRAVQQSERVVVMRHGAEGQLGTVALRMLGNVSDVRCERSWLPRWFIDRTDARVVVASDAPLRC